MAFHVSGGASSMQKPEKYDHFTFKHIAFRSLTSPKQARKPVIGVLTDLIHATGAKLTKQPPVKISSSPTGKSLVESEQIRTRQDTKFYLARIVSHCQELQSIWAKKEFGPDTLVSTSRNIATSQVLEYEIDRTGTDRLLNKIQALIDSGKIDNIWIKSDAARPQDGGGWNPASCVRDGICAGATLSVARSYLGKQGAKIASVPKILEICKEIEKRKGPFVDAPAIQSAYASIEFKNPETLADIEKLIFKQLVIQIQAASNLKLPNETLFGIDESSILQALYQCDERYADIDTSYSQLCSEYKNPNSEFARMAKEIFSEARDIQSPLLGRDSKGRRHIQDLKLFRTEMERKIQEKYDNFTEGEGLVSIIIASENRQHQLNNLEWLMALLELRSYFIKAQTQSDKKIRPLDCFTNPKIRFVNQVMYFDNEDLTTMDVVANLEYLKLEQTTSILGPPGTFPSDSAVLSRLPLLQMGAYQLYFKTGKRAHSTLYIKEEGQSWLYDPNLGLFRCTPETENAILKKWLRFYRLPKNMSPFAQPGEPDHEIILRRIIKVPRI